MRMRDIVVAAVQMASPAGACEDNAQRMRTLLDEAAGQGAQLVFFPEACLTGYSTDRARDIALAADHACVRAVEEAARELGVAVGFGYIEAVGEGERPFVTYEVFDGARVLTYRKTHLGSREQGVFAAGDSLPVCQAAGACVGVHLCWESHLPDISTTLRARGAEILAVPHAAPAGGERRRSIWMRILAARAYDNGAYVVACNALRNEDSKSGRGGGLAVFDPKGQVMAEYYGEDEHVLVCNLPARLPRDASDDSMHFVSYFDRRRPELYA